MRILQFTYPADGNRTRVGAVVNDRVVDLTSAPDGPLTVHELYYARGGSNRGFDAVVTELIEQSAESHDAARLLDGGTDGGPRLISPITPPDDNPVGVRIWLAGVTHQDSARPREIEAKLVHYERVELALQEALESARETARSTAASAEEKARLIIQEAELRAETILRDAERERHEIGPLAVAADEQHARRWRHPEREEAGVVPGRGVRLDTDFAAQPPTRGRRDREWHADRLSRNHVHGRLGDALAVQEKRRANRPGPPPVAHDGRLDLHRPPRLDDPAHDPHVRHRRVDLRPRAQRQQRQVDAFGQGGARGVTERSRLEVAHDHDFAPQVLRALQHASRPCDRRRERLGKAGVLRGKLVMLQRAFHVDAQVIRLPGLGDVSIDAAIVDRSDQ